MFTFSLNNLFDQLVVRSLIVSLITKLILVPGGGGGGGGGGGDGKRSSECIEKSL